MRRRRSLGSRRVKALCRLLDYRWGSSGGSSARTGARMPVNTVRTSAIFARCSVRSRRSGQVGRWTAPGSGAPRKRSIRRGHNNGRSHRVARTTPPRNFRFGISPSPRSPHESNRTPTRAEGLQTAACRRQTSLHASSSRGATAATAAGPAVVLSGCRSEQYPRVDRRQGAPTMVRPAAANSCGLDGGSAPSPSQLLSDDAESRPVHDHVSPRMAVNRS